MAARVPQAAAFSRARSALSEGFSSRASASSCFSSNCGSLTTKESTRATASGSSGSETPMRRKSSSLASFSACCARSSATSDWAFSTSACRTSSMVDWPTAYLARASARKSALRCTCWRSTSVVAAASSALRYWKVMSLRSTSRAFEMSASTASRLAFWVPVLVSTSPDRRQLKESE